MVMPREFGLRAGGSTPRVRVVSDDVVEVDGRRVAVEVSPVDESTFVVTAGGARHTVHVAVDGERAWAAAGGEAFEIEPAAAAPVTTDPGGGGAASGGVTAPSGSDGPELSAPMPATVTAVLVSPGDSVAAGDAIVRLEAMKMELVVAAPRASRVATVDCREGDLVRPGRPLVTLEGDPDDGRPDVAAGG